MRAAERLRGLDRRAEDYGNRFRAEFDTRPPVWLRYAWLLGFFGLLTFPLSMVTSAGVSMAVVLIVLAAYVAVALRWRAKHRV
jgi:hypothetical protein